MRCLAVRPGKVVDELGKVAALIIRKMFSRHREKMTSHRSENSR